MGRDLRVGRALDSSSRVSWPVPARSPGFSQWCVRRVPLRRAIWNPEGILSFSPGLARSAYPGKLADKNPSTLKGLHQVAGGSKVGSCLNPSPKSSCTSSSQPRIAGLCCATAPSAQKCIATSAAFSKDSTARPSLWAEWTTMSISSASCREPSRQRTWSRRESAVLRSGSKARAGIRGLRVASRLRHFFHRRFPA